eukprot:superscaffoldBa00008602_g23480
MDPGDSVAKLHEIAQRARSELSFEEVSSVGPDHDKTFTVKAVLDGKAYDSGVGKTKKEAKKNAAENALRLLEVVQQNPADSSENATANPIASVNQMSISDNNYVSWLHEYCEKKRISIKTVESISLESNTAFLKRCSFVVDGKEYPAGFGKTKKEAKEQAAEIAYQSLGVKSTDQRARGPNFVGIVDHYCHKTGRILNFIEVKRCGPPHNLQLFYKAVINDRDYPVGEGKNIKEAKQNAAQQAWFALQEQSDWDSKDAVKNKNMENRPSDTSNQSRSTSNSSSQYLYIKMELCDTKTLKDWINEKNKETLQDSKRREESLPIAQQIVSGVECVHSKKLIHRDLKRSKKTYDRKVDIFALGLIYLELLWNLSTGHERGV